MARISCIHKTASTSSAAGGPYSTISSWVSSLDRATNGAEWGVICDDGSAYAEEVDITGAVSGTDLIRLTSNDGDIITTIDGGAAPDVRPTGPFQDGAHIKSTGSGPTILVSVNYVAIDHLSLTQNGTGPAVVQLSTDLDEIVVAYCAIEVQADIADSCGVLLDMQSAFQNVLVGGCAFLGHDRAAIMREQAATTGDHTGGKDGADLSLIVTHCSGYSPDADATMAGFVVVAHNSTSTPDGDETGVSVENSIGGWHGPSGGSRVTSFADGTTTSRGTPNGVVVWDGSNNYEEGGQSDLDGTDNLTSWISASADPGTVESTQSSGTYWTVVALADDHRPLDAAAGNAIIGAGLASASLKTGTAVQQTIYDNTRDLRGYTYAAAGALPDLGPFSFEDHSTIPFIAQGQTI